jgi:hypothetical protein
VAGTVKFQDTATKTLLELDCWPPLSVQMTAPFRMPMSGT